MAYGSKNNQGEREGFNLGTLANPFVMTGRTVKGLFTSVDDMLRGLARAGGSIFSDVIAEPVRGLVPGGDPGFWRDEKGGFRSSTFEDVVKPMGKSFANTLDVVGDLTYLPNALFKGVDEANAEWTERATEYQTDPFNFLLEHVGNAALVGSLVAKPAQLGIASSRGAIPAGAAVTGLRPLAGRAIRRTAKEATKDAAKEAATQGRRFSAPQVVNFADDIVGHPYRTAARKIGQSTPVRLLKNPGMFDPVTKAANPLDNLEDASLLDDAPSVPSEPTVKLYRGMAEEFDLGRVGDEGIRFTDDLDYALSNTNSSRHPYLYEIEVPESRIDVGTSEFADLMGESAGPRGAFLTPDEVADLRRVDPDTLDPLKDPYLEWRKGSDEDFIEVYRGVTDIPVEDLLESPGGWWGSQQEALGYLGESTVTGQLPGGNLIRARIRKKDLIQDPRDAGFRLSDNADVQIEEITSYDFKTGEPSQSYTRPNPVADTSSQIPESKLDNTASELHGLNPDLGPIDKVAQSIGYALEDIKKSRSYQSIFGEEARASRRIREDLRRGRLIGAGALADRVRDMFYSKDAAVGNVNVRRKWDPSRTERLFLRDLKNLGKRKDAERFVDLINDIDVQNVNPGSLGRRAAQVATGARVIGQTLDPQGLLSRIERVIDEAKGINPENPAVALKDMLPGVDPQSLYVLALDAAEMAQGLPEGSLSSALADYITMDRFSDLNRRAQQAITEAGGEVPSAVGARFAIPENQLGVDINKLPESIQDLFEGAAEQYLRDLATQREPMLAEEGIIPEAGSRIGLAVDEPTVFPNTLDDLPLTSEWRKALTDAGRDANKQRAVVEKLQERLNELRESGRATFRRDPESRVQYRQSKRKNTRLPTRLEDIVNDPEFAISRWEAVKEWIGNNPHHSALAVADESLIMAARQTVFDGIDNLIEAIREGQVTDKHVTDAVSNFTYLERLPETREILKDYSAAKTAYREEYIRQRMSNPDVDMDALIEEAIAKTNEIYPSQDLFEVRDPLSGETQGIFPEPLQKIVMGEDVPSISKPTKASMDRTFKETPTGKAIKRTTERLVDEKLKLAQLTTRLEDLEARAYLDPDNAPASARDYLVYARNVAPEQAKQLRALAESGLGGDPKILSALADELDAIPRTLDELNSAEVYLAYLRDIKDSKPAGEYGPGVRDIDSNRGIDTRTPGGARRRGTQTDIDYSRDFRARAYWQDAEFQAWFLARQADEVVRTQGLVQTGRERLLNAGFTADDIGKMTTGQVQQALERLGLRAYQPDQLFGTARKPTAPDFRGKPLEAEWITPFAEQNLMGAAARPSNFEKILFEGLYDPVINTWKVFALPLRLGWQVNNTAGNALLTTLVGQVSPFDYPSLMRASYHAVRDWNRGITSQISIPMTDLYRQELVRTLQKVGKNSDQGRAIQSMLDKDAIVLTNEVMNDISSSGLTRGDFAWLNNSQFLRDIGAQANQNVLQQFGVQTPRIPGKVGERARNLRQTGKEVVDFATHINETVDNMHRAVVYLDQIGKGATHAEAMSQVVKALGDYNKMTSFERRVVKRVYPFYPWMRHITEVVTKSLAPDNIHRSLIFTHLTNIFGEPNEWEELLPEWAAGHIYMGQDKNGQPKFLSTRGLNPFLDVFDPLSQPNMRGVLRPSSPLIQMGFEQLSGTSVLTGKPFSNPTTPYGSNELARPPLGEQVVRNIPQLAAMRDVFRDAMGQPLTRYGTGEAAFFEGAETGRSSLQDVTQLFGYNVRPLDVERIREKELLDAFKQQEQTAKYQEQLAEQGGRQLRDIVPGF